MCSNGGLCRVVQRHEIAGIGRGLVVADDQAAHGPIHSVGIQTRIDGILVTQPGPTWRPRPRSGANVKHFTFNFVEVYAPSRTAAAAAGIILKVEFFIKEDMNMLVLTRKQGERIVIGAGITVVVNRVKNGRVTIGIEAPQDMLIQRSELVARCQPSPSLVKIQ